MEFFFLSCRAEILLYQGGLGSNTSVGRHLTYLTDHGKNNLCEVQSNSSFTFEPHARDLLSISCLCMWWTGILSDIPNPLSNSHPNCSTSFMALHCHSLFINSYGTWSLFCYGVRDPRWCPTGVIRHPCHTPPHPPTTSQPTSQHAYSQN